MKKIRLDHLVFDKGLAESRERAKAYIMAGSVYVNGQKETKPGTSVAEDAAVEMRGETLPYVSRGGWKLEKALRVFPVDVKGARCIDCGASTGGFTDVLLQIGAAKVYAVDVGYGQLAWSLRTDPRVVCMERTNIRHVTHEQIAEEMDVAVADLSFISLRLVLSPVAALLKPEGEMVKATIHLTRKDDGTSSQVVKSYSGMKPNQSWTMNIAPHDDNGSLGITITIDESTEDVIHDIEVPSDWI